MSNFTLTCRLKTEIFQEHILDKKFNQCRLIYNSCIEELHKRYRLMKESKLYKQNCKYVGSDRNNIFRELDSKYGLTEYSMFSYVKSFSKYFNIDANTGRSMAARAFMAYQTLMFHKSKKIEFKRYGDINSIQGRTNSCGMRFRNGVLYFNKLTLPVIINKNDIYAQLALQNKIKYCGIKRVMIKGRYHYYIQFVLEGLPPTKINNITGEFKHRIDNTNAKVGIDIGIQTIAYCSDKEVKLLELAPDVRNIEKEKRIINRKLDRSRRSMNPNKFNENGTYIKNHNGKWIKSNRYIKTLSKIKEIQRKNTEIRKQSHNKLANHLLTIGTDIKVEQMNYLGLQSRFKKISINEKSGKTKTTRRFGKGITNKAPSMFLTILNYKLNFIQKELKKVDTYKVKASQYNHLTDKYVKKKLSQRWNNFGEFKIQRDLYSAFLIMNVKDNLNEVDRDLCFENFDNFKKLHDEEIKRIRTGRNKLVSSMGI